MVLVLDFIADNSETVDQWFIVWQPNKEDNEFDIEYIEVLN